jgi:hypothetical protein
MIVPSLPPELSNLYIEHNFQYEKNTNHNDLPASIENPAPKIINVFPASIENPAARIYKSKHISKAAWDKMELRDAADGHSVYNVEDARTGEGGASSRAISIMNMINVISGSNIMKLPSRLKFKYSLRFIIDSDNI